jgi:hypothetical protein
MAQSRLAMLVVIWATACAPTLSFPSKKSDAGSGSAGNTAVNAQCPAGFTLCERTCCPNGTSCVAGACQYPYNSAHLYVYLCPSFNTGNCKANFFALDQTCSPVTATQSGTCYDTGFEVAADHTYGLAGCTTCGSGCGSTGSFRTPRGFLEPKYYSGSTWSCGNDKCTAPADCGGTRGDAGTGSGVASCASSECFLSALSIKQSGAEVPHAVIRGTVPPASTVSKHPSDTPRITKLNGMLVSMSSQGIALPPLRTTTDSVELDYEFDDPTGCSPGACISFGSCPKNLQCNLGTSVCTHAKHDGALAGSVIQTLGFKTEPADPASTAELPLQIQPIAGPMDPMTGTCKDPIDDSDPSQPVLARDALIGDPAPFTATIVGPGPSGGTGGSPARPDGGTGGANGSGGKTGTGSCGLPLQCKSDADCSGFGGRNCSPTNGARCGPDGLCHCCYALCSSGTGNCSCISCASGCTNDQSCMGSVCAFNVGGTPCD